MITDDEIMRLIEEANPVPRRDHGTARNLRAPDVASYLAELRARDAVGTPDDDDAYTEPDRRPRWLLVSAAASVAAIVAGALVLVARDRESTQAEQRVISVPEAVPDGPYYFNLQTSERTPLANAADGFYHQPSPDGTRLLFYTDQEVLSIANADGSGAIALDLVGSPVWEPARWSPDGSSIVYEERMGSQLGNLFVHELATGLKTQITDLEMNSTDFYWLAPSFSPDGQQVIYMQERTGDPGPGFDVWSVPVTGGDPEVLIEDAAFPRYLPDGRIVYVRDEPFGTELLIADPDGSTRLLAEGLNGIESPTPSPDGTRVAYFDGDADAGDGGIYVIHVATGEAVKLDGTQDANRWEWADAHTLLISPDPDA